MLIAVLNDTHFGARNDQEIFLNHQKDFFENCFFPYCKEHNIKKILHLGDLFDRRKYINFKTLERANEMFFSKLKENDMTVDIIPGNHDVYYKDSNRVNSLSLVLGNFPNIKVYDEKPEIVTYDDRKIALVPWICRENAQVSLDFLNQISGADVDVVAGHFEISGFEIMPGIEAHEGLSQKLFSKFKEVWSGHFHHKSEKGNIKYLGTQFELTWSDSGHKKGFHVYDTVLDQIYFVENVSKIFKKVYYDDSIDLETHDFNQYRGNIVRIIVVKKSNHFLFDRFIDEMQKVNPYNVSIVEDHHTGNIGDFNIEEMEKSLDTMTLLEMYVDENIDLPTKNKNSIKKILRELHVEAMHLN